MIRKSNVGRAALVLLFLAHTACGGPNDVGAASQSSRDGPYPYRLSDGSTTFDLAVWERDNARASARYRASGSQEAATPSLAPTPISARPIAVSTEKLAAYQKAVADMLRDPEATRFRGTWVVRDSNGTEGLCGEMNAKNAYGGYVGYEPFYAGIVVVAGKPIAPAPWLVSSVGLDAIREQCQRV